MCLHFIGIHLRCEAYLVTLQNASVNASVNISTQNNENQECDETFTVKIILGEDGKSSSDGFRLGPRNTASITVKDDEGNIRLLQHFLHSVACSILLHNILP